MEGVRQCEEGMSEYESLLWPSQMFTRIVDVERVQKAIVTRKVLIVSGNEDRLMTVTEKMEKMAEEYRAPIVKVKGGHNIMRDLYWVSKLRRTASCFKKSQCSAQECLNFEHSFHSSKKPAHCQSMEGHHFKRNVSRLSIVYLTP
jgi:hypothetical protein